MPGILDWLQAPAYQQPTGISPEMMAMAGVPRTSRMQAIGKALMGFGQGLNQAVAQGRGGGLGGLAGGLAAASGAYQGQEETEREQTMQRLLMQAQIAKLMKGDAGETSEFERLIKGMPPEQQAKLTEGRLSTLATENRPPTWQPATPEELAATGYPMGTQKSSLGEYKPPPGEYFTSPKERESLDIQRLTAQAAQGNATATRQLAQAQFEALEADRARQSEAREFDQSNRSRDDVASLRKEFDSKPEVQNYKIILPTYKSALEAFKSRGPGSDLEFVYATGKILDPIGAVREGEQAAISNSQSPANILAGFLDWVKGGNKLTDDQRQQLLQIMDRRTKQAHTLYRGAVDSFTGYATDYGVEPGKVVRNIGDPPELPTLGDSAPGSPASVPAGTPVPRVKDDILNSVYGP